MKVNYLTLLAGATLVLLSAAATRAEESAASALATEANAAPATTPSPATAPSPTMASNGPAPCVLGDTATYYEDSDPVQDFMLRAGAWAVHSSGSPTQVGQYENVRQSSRFFDLEGMMSNCDHSLDMSLQGNDNDTDDARVHYFGPAVEANVVYQRFDHQLYQNSYAGWVTVPAASSGSNANFNVASRDNFNPGQDYAMHVQDFKADFHGNLTDNLKWYVNTFGMEKTGERQANAVAMCLTVPASHPPIPYTNGTNTTDQCHAVSQVQHIDWQTTEVEAGLELRLGAVTVNYSHMYRDFQAFDQQVSSVYPYNSHSGPNSPLGEGFQTTGGTLYSLAGYDIVPNTVTQMDRIKAHAELGCATDAYVLGYLGDTGDELNQMNRHYTGGDLRITNKSIENLTLTGYGRAYTEHTNAQGLALGGGTITSDSLYASPPPLYSQQQYYQQTPWYPNPLSYLPAAASTANAAPPPPLDRDREAVGFTARWLPFGDDCDFVRRHLAVVGGYEYSTEHYQNTGGTADYEYPGGRFLQPARHGQEHVLHRRGREVVQLLQHLRSLQVDWDALSVPRLHAGGGYGGRRSEHGPSHGGKPRGDRRDLDHLRLPDAECRRLSGDGVEQWSLSCGLGFQQFPLRAQRLVVGHLAVVLQRRLCRNGQLDQSGCLAVRLGLGQPAGGLHPGDVQQPFGRSQPGNPLRLDPEALDVCHVRVCSRRERHEHSRVASDCRGAV